MRPRPATCLMLLIGMAAGCAGLPREISPWDCIPAGPEDLSTPVRSYMSLCRALRAGDVDRIERCCQIAPDRREWLPIIAEFGTASAEAHAAYVARFGAERFGTDRPPLVTGWLVPPWDWVTVWVEPRGENDAFVHTQEGPQLEFVRVDGRWLFPLDPPPDPYPEKFRTWAREWRRIAGEIRRGLYPTREAAAAKLNRYVVIYVGVRREVTAECSSPPSKRN